MSITLYIYIYINYAVFANLVKTIGKKPWNLGKEGKGKQELIFF